jgi:hypothetical protein
VTRTAARIGVIATWIAAEIWQAFFGALTSLQLGAPGIGDRASWVPNLFVAEAATLLPLGFVLAVWAKPNARIAAIGIAALMLALAIVGVATLSRGPDDAPMLFLFVAPPPILLILATRRLRSAVPPFV